MYWRFLSVLSCLALSACASSAPLAEPPDIATPEEYVALPAETTAAEADWIQSLGDDALPHLVAEALLHNPDLHTAQANFEAAQAQARVAAAARLPTLNATVSARFQHAVEATTIFGAGLDAAWQADIWGRLSDQSTAASLSAEAVEADYYGLRLAIAGATARYWFALAEARLQTELARRDIAMRTHQLELVEARFERGLAQSSDVRTVRSVLASAEATLLTRITVEENSARALETLLGRYPRAEIEAATELPLLAAAPAPGEPAALFSRRPDIVAAELRLGAAGFSAEAARKALYPSLNFTAGLSTQASDLSELFSPSRLVASLAAALLAPLFQGGALRAERDRLEALAHAQASRYVATVLTAFEEVENALAADARHLHRVEALQRAFDEAEAARELLERQYAGGMATTFELIDAQARLIQAESQLIAARRDHLDNRILLYLAIAGDFAADDDAASPRQPGADHGDQ